MFIYKYKLCFSVAAEGLYNSLVICVLSTEVELCVCFCVCVYSYGDLYKVYIFSWRNFCPDCARSVFHCCPDGITPAKGWNYRGCPGIVWSLCSIPLALFFSVMSMFFGLCLSVCLSGCLLHD